MTAERSSPGRAPGVLLLVLAAALLSGSEARAGFIAMDTRTAVEVREDRVSLHVTTTNHGDEAAWKVQIEAQLPDRTESSPLFPRVGIGETVTHTFEWRPAGRAQTRVVPLLTHFSDANGYAFSTVSRSLLALAPPPPAALAARVEPVELDPAGSLRVVLRSLDGRPHEVHVRLAAPAEIDVSPASLPVSVPGDGEAEAEFQLANFSGLVGSSHRVLAVVGEEAPGGRVEIDAPGEVRLLAATNSAARLALRTLLALAALAFLAWQLGSRRRHPAEGLASRLPVLVGGLMLLFAVAFVAEILAASLDPGGLDSGDDSIHSAYTLAVDRLVQETHWPFGWNQEYGLGAPNFIFRPPGFHLSVQALDLLSFRAFPLAGVHKFAYLLALALYPVGIFYLLRKFRFSPLICGIGALLAIAPISSWGHTLDAYYSVGLAKQAFAILAVPFFLGKLHGILRNGERLLPGALLFGFMFLNHPYLAWGTGLLAGLYFGIDVLASRDWRGPALAIHARKAGRLSAVVVAGGLLIAFWLLPFYSSAEIKRTTPFSSGAMRSGFTVAVDTAASTLHHYLGGSLLDASETPQQTFGSSGWGWRNRPGTGRWPVLSWGSLLGAALLLLGRPSRRNAFFLAAWLGALVIFLGPDDVPWLRWIPFQEQVLYAHLVPFLELFAVALCGIGLGGLAQGLANLVVGALPALARFAGLVACGFSLALALPVVSNVYAERADHARHVVRTRPFEFDRHGQTPRSRRLAENAALGRATDRLEEQLSPPQRFYGSPTGPPGTAAEEFYHFTLAPGYLQRTNLISPHFGALHGGVNKLAHSTFRKDLWRSRTLTELLDVGAVITTAGNRESYPLLEDLYRVGIDDGRWIVYERVEPSAPVHFTAARPLLVAGDAAQWMEACRTWLRSVEPLPDLAGVPFLAWQMSRPGEGDGELPLDSYSGVYLAGADPAAYFRPGELEAYLAGGGRIDCRESLEGGDLECPRADPRTLLAAVPAGEADPPFQLISYSQERHRQLAEVEVAAPGFLLFKTAFYRGWVAELDGGPAPNHALSPGFNAVHLPTAGRHRVELRYRGANRARLGAALSGLTLLVLIALHLRARPRA